MYDACVVLFVLFFYMKFKENWCQPCLFVGGDFFELSWAEIFILKRAASYVPILSFEGAFYVLWNAIELNWVFVKEFGGNRNPIHFRLNLKPVVASTD